MIFTKHHILLIQAGTKIQTRRFKRPRVKVGNTYSLNTQFYKKENLGRIRITDLRQKALGNVTPGDAKNSDIPQNQPILQPSRKFMGRN